MAACDAAGTVLHKYKKQDAPGWQRKLLLFLGVLCGATVLLFIAWAITLFVDRTQVDDCLAIGGTYNDQIGECELAPGRQR